MLSCGRRLSRSRWTISKACPHFLVRFEDLVARPLETMRRLVDSLGIKLSTPMRAHLERIQDATADSYHAEHQVHWYRANHERRVGRWRDNLTGRPAD